MAWTMAHPDAMQALLSGQSEINAHFGSPPFQYQELAKPGMHMVLNNYEVMGGAVTFNLVWTTEKFRSANPKLYEAFVKALDEAETTINRDKRAAAEAYIRISKDKDTVDNIARMMNDPQIVYTTTPQNVGQGSLRRAVTEYVEHYHRERNHQGLENRLIQLPVAATADHGAIHCSARLGGTLNFYYREAA